HLAPLTGHGIGEARGRFDRRSKWWWSWVVPFVRTCAVLDSVDGEREVGVFETGALIQIADVELAQESPGTDDDNAVGGLLHLGHQMAGDQHATALLRESTHEPAHPTHAVGIEPIDRLVEDDRAGVAQ